MTPGRGTFLERLRRRPLTERRILAITVYLTAAVLTIAFWVTSLEGTFRHATAPKAGRTPAIVGESAPPAETEGTSPSPPPSPEPATPFQVLSETLRGTVAGLRELNTELKKLTSTPAPRAETPSPLPMVRGERAPLTMTSPESGTKLKSEQQGPIARPPADGPANALTLLASKPYSHLAAARLVRVGDDGALEPAPHEGSKNRFGAVVRYNLGALYQTAIDVYHYLTE